MTTTNTETTHVFSHLGQSPYRYVGMTENKFSNGDGTWKPGGCCDHCATGILYEFRFRSADGKVFKVGSSCVEKSGDAGLRRVISADVRKLDREKRQARAGRVADELDGLIETHKDKLASMAHPKAWLAEKGETMLDNVLWLRERCGAAGTSRLLKQVKELVQ